MLKQSEEILERVSEEFNSCTNLDEISVYSIYIQFMTKTGIILFEDMVIDQNTLIDLIDHKKVKCEGSFVHQGEKSIRYRFLGYKYPEKFYRGVSNSLKQIVLEKYERCCVQCSSYSNLQIDHIYPWSKGGLTELNNLQVLCRRCNSAKANKS